VLTTKFDILVKPNVPDSQTGRSDFYNYNMVKISISKSVLCISQVGLICMFFMLCTCFLEDLDGFHPRKKRSAWKDKNMELT
jgi:hypothetical protein